MVYRFRALHKQYYDLDDTVPRGVRACYVSSKIQVSLVDNWSKRRNDFFQPIQP